MAYALMTYHTRTSKAMSRNNVKKCVHIRISLTHEWNDVKNFLHVTPFLSCDNDLLKWGDVLERAHRTTEREDEKILWVTRGGKGSQ